MTTPPGPSSIVLATGAEILAVGVFTLIAGASGEAGTLMVVFMIGLWILFIVTDSAVITHIGNSFDSLIAKG